MNGEFVDTNLLIYAHNGDAGAEGRSAVELLRRLQLSGTGRLSTQVLHEFFHNITRKFGLPAADARAIVEDFGHWNPIVITHAMTLAAIDLQTRYQLSFWDALIVAAAQEARAEVLWTEDLNHGQKYGSVEVRNPFLA